jgi:uncharacterized protein (UPF0276 family)
MQLTTNLSGPLIELLRRQAAPIDGIEVGPWINPRKIMEHRKRLPGIPFYFHGGDYVNGLAVVPGTLQRIKDYLEITGSPWLSLHITFLFPGMQYIFRKRNWKFPSINTDRATRGFVQKIQKFTRCVNVPILLENPSPIPLYENLEIQPDRIHQILKAADCRLLLDIGHARLSAEIAGITAEEYILNLPMDRVDQVHVSGPRIRGGHLFDAHEPLQEMDYRLFEFVLAHAKPKVVTLEYIRQIDPLREQLNRLRGIMDDRKL